MTMIYIKSNSSECMISELNSYGISSTDCSVSALPQIYVLVNNAGTLDRNVVIDNDKSYVFEKIANQYRMVSVNPSEDIKQKCINIKVDNHNNAYINKYEHLFVILSFITVIITILTIGIYGEDILAHLDTNCGGVFINNCEDK